MALESKKYQSVMRFSVSTLTGIKIKSILDTVSLFVKALNFQVFSSPDLEERMCKNFYCFCCLLQTTSFVDFKILENAWTSETMDSENAKYFKNKICKTLYCFIVPLFWHDATHLKLQLFLWDPAPRWASVHIIEG